jgi:hypothetical protein
MALALEVQMINGLRRKIQIFKAQDLCPIHPRGDNA